MIEEIFREFQEKMRDLRLEQEKIIKEYTRALEAKKVEILMEVANHEQKGS